MMNKIFLDSNILIYLYTADELDKINKIQVIEGRLKILNPFK